MSPTWYELLVADHEITEQLFDAVAKACAAPMGPTRPFLDDAVTYLTEYVDGCHNKKEEDHLFPLLERRGVPRQGGPLAVMIAEHEQSRALLANVGKAGRAYAAGDMSRLDDFRAAFEEYSTLVKNHYWKENDILFSMARRVLGEADTTALLAGFGETEAVLGPDTHDRYYAMAHGVIEAGGIEDLSFALPRETIAAMLNALPVELSFVDADDRVRYFSHENQEKIFGRTRGAIGTPVQNCHPAKSLHMVEAVLDDFKAGRREVAEFWIEMGGRFVLIRYFPVRDPNGAYLGTMEVVQDVTAIRALVGQKRLLD
jgi:hypothetical protein